MSHEEYHGWLGCIGDCTTQLYRDFNKPLYINFFIGCARDSEITSCNGNCSTVTNQNETVMQALNSYPSDTGTNVCVYNMCVFF